MLLPWINTRLLYLKIHYFLIFAATGCTLPYGSAIGRRNGIPEATIAYILTVTSLLAIPWKILMGYIADRTQNVTRILLTLQSLAILFHGLLYFSDFIIKTAEPKGEVSCPEGNVTLLNSFSVCLQPPEKCFVSCATNATEFSEIEVSYIFQNTSAVCHTIWNGTSGYHRSTCQFKCPCTAGSIDQRVVWFYAVFHALGSLCSGAVLIISDAGVSEILAENVRDFGLQRAGGAIGMGAAGPVVGALIDAANRWTGGRSGYLPSYFVYALLIILDSVLLCCMPTLRMPKLSVNFFKDIYGVFINVELAVFAFWTCALGALFSIYMSYNTWFLEDIGASKLIIGLISAVSCICIEVPFYSVSGWILKKTRYYPSYILTFLIFGVRYIGSAFLYNPWFALLVEPVTGAAHPLVTPAMTVFAKEVAPEGTAASVLCVLNICEGAIGKSLGTLVGGTTFAEFGGRWMFFYSGVFAAGCALLCLVSHVLVQRRTSRHGVITRAEVGNTVWCLGSWGEAGERCGEAGGVATGVDSSGKSA
ncbi:maltose permease [Ixodes scapularis]|uniref:maltose permease n=1 Tax=Ixodes scapularis TaxID=6945 RepID=UPI001C38E610|nr:maltose permease [Ixodes scapularis]